MSLLQDGLCVASTRPGTFSFEPTVVQILSPRFIAVAGRSFEFEVFDIISRKVQQLTEPNVLFPLGCSKKGRTNGLDSRYGGYYIKWSTR